MAKNAKGSKKRDKREGGALQRKATALLLGGNTGNAYVKTRRSAEWHLGMWDWEKHVPAWKLPAIVDDQNKRVALCSPFKCNNIKSGKTVFACPHLPAGSENCKNGECPEER
jgi:hypothetical protein